ncbi:hypothetical protein O1L60_17010 [Streptomyces diastatochromogenes]|nr:hypothetical protein [Streptomyces diastatochromogenes]
MRTAARSFTGIVASPPAPCRARWLRCSAPGPGRGHGGGRRGSAGAEQRAAVGAAEADGGEREDAAGHREAAADQAAPAALEPARDQLAPVVDGEAVTGAAQHRAEVLLEAPGFFVLGHAEITVSGR